MPFVHIRIAGKTLSENAVRALQTGITGQMETILTKKAELTAVSIETVPAGGWAIGGATVPIAAHLEATITAGTNTAEEKAHFIAAAMALVETVLETPLPLATYVVIREVPAESWGYGGRTQAARRLSAEAA